MSYRIAGVGLFNPSRERLWFRGMEWIIPKYSNAVIDKAGARLVKPKAWLDEEDFGNALDIVENHRAAHSFPLLVFCMGLSHRAKKDRLGCSRGAADQTSVFSGVQTSPLSHNAAFAHARYWWLPCGCSKCPYGQTTRCLIQEE